MDLERWFSEASEIVAAEPDIPLISSVGLDIQEDVCKAWDDLESYEDDSPKVLEIPPHDPRRRGDGKARHARVRGWW